MPKLAQTPAACFTSSNLNTLACPASTFWSILNFLASECATAPSYTQIRSQVRVFKTQQTGKLVCILVSVLTLENLATALVRRLFLCVLCQACGS